MRRVPSATVIAFPPPSGTSRTRAVTVRTGPSTRHAKRSGSPSSTVPGETVKSSRAGAAARGSGLLLGGLLEDVAAAGIGRGGAAALGEGGRGDGGEQGTGRQQDEPGGHSR